MASTTLVVEVTQTPEPTPKRVLETALSQQQMYTECEEGHPEVNIDQEVMDALTSVWEKSTVVKLLDILCLLDYAEEAQRAMANGGENTGARPVTRKLNTILPIVGTYQNHHSLDKNHRPTNIPGESGMGKPFMVDLRTIYTNRGRFARICVEQDLEKPLKGMVVINGERYLVEYEGLPTICFDCDWYGHLKNGTTGGIGEASGAEQATSKYHIKAAPSNGGNASGTKSK
ncbi:hypothetical protein V2J09_016679 [Rumex salicifolius]